MTLLTIDKAKEMSVLSGEPSSLPFYVWWQKESENEKVKEITESFIKIEPLFSFLQTKNCNIINKEEITDFLNNHISIIDYLYEAPDVIRKKFGNVNLNLELFFDPEVEDDRGELFLNIEIDLDAKKAHEKLKEIDREWLLKRVNENIGKFNLNLEFI